MKDATHFIEVYRPALSNVVLHHKLLAIEKLNQCLNISLHYNCKTIAIFKIKLKNK